MPLSWMNLTCLSHNKPAKPAKFFWHFPDVFGSHWQYYNSDNNCSHIINIHSGLQFQRSTLYSQCVSSFALRLLQQGRYIAYCLFFFFFTSRHSEKWNHRIPVSRFRSFKLQIGDFLGKLQYFSACRTSITSIWHWSHSSLSKISSSFCQDILIIGWCHVLHSISV